MPRTVWSGAISFGLVTVPIHVVSAVEDHNIRFHRVHLADMARVRTRKVCELEDREVSTSEIGKGYEISRDHIVPVTDQELRDLPLPTAKAIEIVAFMPLSSIDPIRICVRSVSDRGQVVLGAGWSVHYTSRELPEVVKPAWSSGYGAADLRDARPQRSRLPGVRYAGRPDHPGRGRCQRRRQCVASEGAALRRAQADGARREVVTATGAEPPRQSGDDAADRRAARGNVSAWR
jgi:hypothetical protein